MVLEDTDGDGRMDKSTPLVDDMINVRSIAFVEGGVFVESGAIWFCQDDDDDFVVIRKQNLWILQLRIRQYRACREST